MIHDSCETSRRIGLASGDDGRRRRRARKNGRRGRRQPDFELDPGFKKRTVIIGREKAPPALTSAHTPRHHSKTMSTTISSVALGLNGGCCFAYAVLFGVMQTRLLEMYGVEVRAPPG